MEKDYVSLKGMAEGKEPGIQKATYFKVDPRILVVEEGFNAREEGDDLNAHLESLEISMRAGASVPPIDVRVEEGRIIIVDGHCRTRAALRLIESGIEYMLEARQFRGNDAERVAHMLSSAQGKPLTPLEAGRSFMRLMRYGWDAKAISDRIGKTTTTVNNYILLAESPTALQQMIARGEVPAHVAITTIQQHGHEKAVVILQGGLVKAKEAGKAKVTNKTLSGSRIPAKTATAIAASAGRLLKQFETENLAEFPDEYLVAVPAKELKVLLAAMAEIKQPDTTQGE